MELIAIKLFFGRIWKFLSELPWQVWAGIAVVALCGASYCVGETDGVAKERAANEKEVAEIRKKRDQAAKRAEEADAKLAAIVAKNILERRTELDNDTAL